MDINEVHEAERQERVGALAAQTEMERAHDDPEIHW